MAPQDTQVRGSPSPPNPDILKRQRTLSSLGKVLGPPSKAHTKQRKSSRLFSKSNFAPRNSAQHDETDEKLQAEKPVLDVEQALKYAYPLEREQEARYEDCDYDSLYRYFVPKDEEKMSVRKELERLAEVVKCPHEPLQFLAGQRLGRGDAIGYRALGVLSERLDKAIDICIVDNDGITLENGNLGASPNDFRRVLERIRVDDFGNLKLTKLDSDMTKIWTTDAELVEDAVALYEFVSASLARYISQIARGQYWLNKLLGAMAKFGSKVKYVLRDLQVCAGESVRHGDLAVAAYMESYGKTDKEGADEDDGPSFERFKNHLKAESGALDLDVGYFELVAHCLDQMKIRKGFIRSLEHILILLRPGRRHSGFGPTEFEVCGVVIETGFHDFQALIFQDRDFEFLSTSDLDQLNFAHPAFEMLDLTIRHFSRQRLLAPPLAVPEADRAGGTKTTVEWNYSESCTELVDRDRDIKISNGGTRPLTLELKTMNEITAVLVLLTLGSPAITSLYKAYLDLFYLTEDLFDTVRPFPERPFKAYVRVYTNDFEEARRRQARTHASPLAEAFNQGLFSRTSLLATGDSNTESRKRAQELELTIALMEEWVYTEDAVVVQCKLYVLLVALGVIVLVLGGLATGVTLHQRLAGVDPFDITVYSWALAAFIVVVCKAVLVRDWAWSDFLQGRVRCRSVSELRAVTGINEQLVIAKLLHDELQSVLQTRGPYNAVFLRKDASGSSGFSIDVPISTKTLLLSGLSMLKVETPFGHALVCLDSRRGSEASLVNHRSVAPKSEWLVCKDLDRIVQAARKDHGRIGPVKLPLRPYKAEWRRVEGIYNVLDAVFV